MLYKKFNYLALIGSILVLLIGVYTLISPMRSQDGMWIVFDDVHTVRTQEMVVELRSGQFPVRLLNQLGNGGGYLLFNFYSPLVYYLSAALVFLGSAPLNAAKLLFQFAYVVASFGMFFFLKSQWPKKWLIPLVGALLFVSSAYFNYDAYVRGALAELWGFAMIPWVFLSYELLKKTQRSFWILALALVVSAQLYLHAISAFITLPFLGIRLVVDMYQKRINKQDLYRVIFASVVSLGLSATYLLPMLFEKSQVVYSQADFVVSGYKSGFISLQELFGLARSSDQNIKPITLSLFLTIAGMVSYLTMLPMLFHSRVKKSQKTDVIYLTVASALVLFIINQASTVIWQHSSLLQMAQFPFRFTMMAVFLLVWLVSLGVSKLPKPLAVLLAIPLVATSFYINKEFSLPKDFYFADTFVAQDPCATTTWQAEYLPSTTSHCLGSDNAPIASGSGELVVEEISANKGGREIFISTNGKPGTLVVRKYAYPGWLLTTNGAKKEIVPYGPEGVISASLSSEETPIVLKFRNTTVRSVGNIISFISVIVILASFVKFKIWQV